MILRKIYQYLLVLSGIILIGSAYIYPGFRDSGGFIEVHYCLAVSISFALITIGTFIHSRLRRFSLWFALALAGQAVALQMIEAGHIVRYQHYRSVMSLLSGENIFLLVFIVVQSTCVLLGLRNSYKKIWEWIMRAFRKWQLLIIGAVFFFTSASLSRDIPRYAEELFFASFIQLVNLGNIILMVSSIPKDILQKVGQKLNTLLSLDKKEETGKSGSVDRFAVLALVWIIAISTLLNFFVYERHPHIPDEISYLYQARFFSEGDITMPPPPVFEAFEVDLMTYENERWYSPVPPGWPAMLSLGVKFGIPSLINPVLAGICILLIYSFLREIYDTSVARMAILLLCVSPWYVFMSMNYTTHTFSLTCALAGTLAVIRARKHGKAIWGWIGGFAIGTVSLTRPLEGLVIAVLLGMWAIGIGGKRLRTPALAGLILGTIVIGSLTLPYNKILTGSLTKFPIMAYCDEHYGVGSNALGFGPNRGFGWALDPFPGHGPLDAAINTALNTFMINIELFGWSTGSILIIGFILFSGSLRKSDYLMVAVIISVVGIHIFYYFSGGPDFGARYWYFVIIPCVVLTVRGMQYSGTRMNASSNKGGLNRTKIIVAVLLLSISSIVNFFPWRSVDKYHHYRDRRPDIRYIAEENNFGKSLVLIQGDQNRDYTSAAVYNPLDWNANAPIFAWDKNPEVRKELLSVYSDRPVWIVQGATLNNGSFKVRAGPLSAHKLEEGH
jgi:hypothetical protein